MSSAKKRTQIAFRAPGIHAGTIRIGPRKRLTVPKPDVHIMFLFEGLAPDAAQII